jgi:hypothetical protein
MLSSDRCRQNSGGQPRMEVPMRTKILLALIVLCSSVIWAADKVQPFDVKLGLWEVTHPSVPFLTLRYNA